MDACEIQAMGGFHSKRNKQSQKIDVKEIDYNVKSKDGAIVESRTFRIGDHARIFRGLEPAGADITEKDKESAEERSHYPIQGFWTVIDGRDAEAIGAELKTPHGLMRLPLRMLLPMPRPVKESPDEI